MTAWHVLQHYRRDRKQVGDRAGQGGAAGTVEVAAEQQQVKPSATATYL